VQIGPQDRAGIKQVERQRHLRVIFFYASIAWLLGSVGLGAETVSGTALYRERIAAPPDARFVAVLEDVSKADAAAEVLGRVEVDDAGNPPYAFRIDYDPDAINPAFTYAVRASLYDADGALIFATDTVYPVITGGAPAEVEIVMVSVATPAAEQTGALGAHGLRLPATFTGMLPCADCDGIAHHLDLWPDQTYQLRREWVGRDPEGRRDEVGRWHADPARDAIVLLDGTGPPDRWTVESPDRLRLLDPEGNPIESSLPYDLGSDGVLVETDLKGLFLGGMMTYMADAALFEECLTGRSYPVVLEKDYLALERAYLAAAPRPGSEVYVHVEGSLSMRPAMEGPDRRSLVVERFVRTRPGLSCAKAAADPALVNTFWRIESLRGQQVDGAPDRREPYILFQDGPDTRFSATVGCNRMIGGYERDGERLVFGASASTMMACPPPLDALEQALSGVLGDVRRSVASGSTLTLFDEADAAIARLTAVYFP
jgi:uncharacterized lipoprotein YbaY/heat shock protein HslJ